MSKLIKKEFLLSMHPITPLMLLLSVMVLIPNYPYAVMFFYMTLAVFFTCMMGRENQDVIYSLTLPVAKSDIVKARISFVKATVVFFILVVADVVCTHAVPFVRDYLDTPDPQYMEYKLIALGVGIVLYLVMTIGVSRISIKNLEMQDL